VLSAAALLSQTKSGEPVAVVQPALEAAFVSLVESRFVVRAVAWHLHITRWLCAR
jgi:hypothetical protein